MKLSLIPGMRAEMRLHPLQVVSLQLLGQPLAKLEEEIEDALDANYPFLERVDGAPDRSAAGRAEPAPVAEPQPEAPPAPEEPDPRDLDAWRRDERTPVSTEAREPLSSENFAAGETSLADHLLEQLRDAARDGQIRLAGEAIIGNLDDNGYLRIDLSEIVGATATALETVERALALVQTFDPPGVAARSLGECLSLQLRAATDIDPVAVAIVEHHCQDLAHCRYERLARLLQVPTSRVLTAADRIRGLDPKPGRAFGAVDVRPVKPEIVVEKVDGEWAVRLDDRGLPLLRVARPFHAEGEAVSPEERRFIAERRQAARWFIEAIEHRRHTLRSVVETIVRFQRDFFDRGPEHLRPLVLRRVAEEISIHESTVSRAISGKYVDTPHGVFALKHFFPPGVPGPTGDLVATYAVKTELRSLVAGEDRGRPLTDFALVVALRERGFVVARRTVAKYRDELAIPTCQQRKRAGACGTASRPPRGGSA
ncbi:MAG TPA: RNA polymerase factor sigma-54 [Methylomirabilota bacterium]